MDAISNLCARTATADGPSVRRRRPLSPAFKPLVPELLLNVDESSIAVALDLYEDDSPMTAYLPVTPTGWQFAATCIWNLHPPRYHVIRVMIIM